MLPFDDAVFNRAMTMNSMRLWPNSGAGLEKIRRTLRVGGRIAVAFTRFSYTSAGKFERQFLDAGYTEVSLHTGGPGTGALGRA